MTVRPSACFSTARITGIPEASPGFRMPVTTRTSPRVPTSRRPTGFSVSVTAPAGQTSWQPPQLWHTSGNTVGFSRIYIRAWKRQNSTHFLQPVQAAASNSGRREWTTVVRIP